MASPLLNALKRLFSARSDENETPHAVPLVSREWCEFEIVGESHHQDALSYLTHRPRKPVSIHCSATLSPDPNNKHDANAVAVVIKGRTVGYLDRNSAKRFRDQMKALGHEGQPARCRAYINGGGMGRTGEPLNIGVKLGLVWPLAIA